MTDSGNALRRRLDAVRGRIGAACARAGRSADAVTLVAVTKFADLDAIRALHAAGVTDFGENRPQQLVARARELASEPPAPRWHLIGPLQRNKVRATLPAIHLMHSVDSEAILDELENEAERQGRTLRVLLQANVTGAATKHGFSPDDLLRDPARWRRGGRIEVAGLMTMAEPADDPEEARPAFRALRQLRDALADATGSAWPELSMGMSGDFEVAIEEGATLVRLGSVLFQDES